MDPSSSSLLRIDGAHGSGSGTIVRYAVALSALLGRPVQVANVRAKRPKPGLRAQHLSAVLACAELCGGRTDGLHVGSTEFIFVPGGPPRGGRYAWKIGTAGSTTMLAFAVLPLAAWADGPVGARIAGGLFQDFAPSPFHMANVLRPLVRRMGLGFELRIRRPGYVPRGDGEIELSVEPVESRLLPILLEEAGEIRSVRGVALASHLAERRVSARMAEACTRRLARSGLACTIETRDDTAAAQPGASLAVWAESPAGCIFGADRSGAPGRRSEDIGRFVADSLLEDMGSGAAVDRHAADMLILFAALAGGETRYVAPRITDHVETNLWLVSEFGARAERRGKHIRIEGIGFERARAAGGA
jgi:RNA 3'-terminal phosphate cyclase (ATP)